jgi:hypothetical protein
MNQDWTPVTLKGTRSARGEIRPKDAGQSERAHLRRLDETEVAEKRKRVAATSKQELIQARLARSLTQDKADAECCLPKHTMRDIESGRLLPGQPVLRAISKNLGVNLRFEE